MLEIRSQSVEPHHRIEVMEVKMEEHNVDLYRDPIFMQHCLFPEFSNDLRLN